MNKRIVVAMSGGVDSATTAALLKERGFEVIGITMQLLDYKDAEGGCCSIDHVVDARRVAERMGIPHYVVNYVEVFKNYVIDDYVDKYLSGKTPIPCVLCNRFVKFDVLLRRALELGADYLATGHYARIERENGNGKLSLRKAVDGSKDQTYFLFTLGQRELSRLMFPLGSLRKDEVREIAEEMNLTLAYKPDSTGVCFVPTGDYRDFLETRYELNNEQGEIVDVDGNVLGTHKGVYSYTVGQRRGLGIATGVPMYVVRIEPETNRVVVGEDKDIYSTELTADNLSWIVGKTPSDDSRVMAKIRYRHPESEAVLTSIDDGEVLLRFEEPQRAITPGQAVVFYEEDRVLGGGWIREVR